MAHASIRFTKAERKAVSGQAARYWSVSFTAECEGRGPYRAQAGVFQVAGPGDFVGAVPLPPPVMPRWLRSETLSEHLFLYFYDQVQSAVVAADGSLRPLLSVERELHADFEVLDGYWLYQNGEAGGADVSMPAERSPGREAMHAGRPAA